MGTCVNLALSCLFERLYCAAGTARTPPLCSFFFLFQTHPTDAWALTTDIRYVISCSYVRVFETDPLDRWSYTYAPSNGAPRYELQLTRPFHHPWRRFEFYRRVQLVLRATGHWTIGPPFDSHSGWLGSRLLNRGWVRSALPSAPGALPTRSAQWKYLSKPRFGRLGMYGKLELVPYIIERAMWLNSGRYATEQGLWLDRGPPSSAETTSSAEATNGEDSSPFCSPELGVVALSPRRTTQ